MSAVPQGPYRRTGPETNAAEPLPDRYSDLPAVARISLQSIPPGRQVFMIKDEDPPVLSGGGGGWQVTDRWGRKSLTSWSGVQPYTLTFSAIFSAHWLGQDNVEDEIAELLAMYAPRGDFNAPRHVKVTGGPIGTGALEWVINDVTFAPSIATANGARRIQPVDITLLEFVDPDSVIRPTKRAADASNRKHLYVVQTGDTLAIIAKKKLGDAKFADDIRRENLPALADPRSLKAGMTILIPAGKIQKS